MLVSRFYDPQRGQVRVDGHDVRDVTLHSLRRQVGMAFEESFLFSDTIRANIAYGRPDATDAEIEAAAPRRRRRTSFVARPARRLRHRRRRARADAVRRAAPAHRAGPGDPGRPARSSCSTTRRAPSTPAPRRRSTTGCATVLADRTTLLVAHRLSTLHLADRIVVLEHGRVVDDGTHDELTERSPLYRALLSGLDGRGAAARPATASRRWPASRRTGVTAVGLARRRARRPAAAAHLDGPRSGRAARRAARPIWQPAAPLPTCWPRSPRCRRCATTPTSTSPARAAHDREFSLLAAAAPVPPAVR